MGNMLYTDVSPSLKITSKSSPSDLTLLYEITSTNKLKLHQLTSLADTGFLGFGTGLAIKSKIDGSEIPTEQRAIDCINSVTGKVEDGVPQIKIPVYKYICERKKVE